MPIVVFDGVCKKYGNKEALHDISIEIEKGEVILFCGKNGSGKSTTIKLLLKMILLRKSDKGTIKVDDLKIGYVPERVILPRFYKIKDYLKDYFDVKNTGFNYIELTKYFNLDINKKLNQLSKGMIQKVALIQCLDTNNDLFILDEATNGLDDESIKLLINKLKELKNMNKTIIIVTHYKELYNEIYTREITFEASKIIKDSMA